MYREIPTITLGIFYQLLYQLQYFLNLTLVLYHIHINTHITESSTELLSLKPGVWLAQKFEKLE